MKINDVVKQIDVSYNTVKKNVENKPEYHYKKDDVLHVTEEGLQFLADKYGYRAEIMEENEELYYVRQIEMLSRQLEQTNILNNQLIAQIQNKEERLLYITEQKEESYEKLTKKLEEKNDEVNEKNIELLELKHKLEIEENKSLFQRIFKK